MSNDLWKKIGLNALGALLVGHSNAAAANSRLNGINGISGNNQSIFSTTNNRSAEDLLANTLGIFFAGAIDSKEKIARSLGVPPSTPETSGTNTNNVQAAKDGTIINFDVNAGGIQKAIEDIVIPGEKSKLVGPDGKTLLPGAEGKLVTFFRKADGNYVDVPWDIKIVADRYDANKKTVFLTNDEYHLNLNSQTFALMLSNGPDLKAGTADDKMILPNVLMLSTNNETQENPRYVQFGSNIQNGAAHVIYRREFDQALQRGPIVTNNGPDLSGLNPNIGMNPNLNVVPNAGGNPGPIPAPTVSGFWTNPPADFSNIKDPALFTAMLKTFADSLTGTTDQDAENRKLRLVTFDAQNTPMLWQPAGDKGLKANYNGRDIYLAPENFMQIFTQGNIPGHNIATKKDFAFFSEDKSLLEKITPIFQSAIQSATNSNQVLEIKPYAPPAPTIKTPGNNQSGIRTPGKTGGAGIGTPGPGAPANTQKFTEAEINALVDGVFAVSKGFWRRSDINAPDYDPKAFDKWSALCNGVGFNRNLKDSRDQVIPQGTIVEAIQGNMAAYYKSRTLIDPATGRPVIDPKTGKEISLAKPGEKSNPLDDPSSPFYLKTFLKKELSKPGANLAKIKEALETFGSVTFNATPIDKVPAQKQQLKQPQRQQQPQLQIEPINPYAPLQIRPTGPLKGSIGTPPKNDSAVPAKQAPVVTPIQPPAVVAPIKPAELANTSDKLDSFIIAIGTAQTSGNEHGEALRRDYNQFIKSLEPLKMGAGTKAADTLTNIKDYYGAMTRFSFAPKDHDKDQGKQTFAIHQKFYLMQRSLQDLAKYDPKSFGLLTTELKKSWAAAHKSDPDAKLLKQPFSPPTVTVKQQKNAAKPLGEKKFFAQGGEGRAKGTIRLSIPQPEKTYVAEVVKPSLDTAAAAISKAFPEAAGQEVVTKITGPELQPVS